MRDAFAHEAILRMDPDADTRAPGAAITVALCGHWDHLPPCPLAPHHTSVKQVGAEVHVRTLFAVAPGRETDARQRIEAALAAGKLTGPNDEVTRWEVRSCRASAVHPSEVAHAERLVMS